MTNKNAGTIGIGASKDHYACASSVNERITYQSNNGIATPHGDDVVGNDVDMMIRMILDFTVTPHTIQFFSGGRALSIINMATALGSSDYGQPVALCHAAIMLPKYALLMY